MAHTALGDIVRAHRRTLGLTQENLAEDAGLSLSVVRKVEQGGSARVETLHSLARALGVPTSTLFTPREPDPVRDDGGNRPALAQLRRALMPPVGLKETLADAEAAVDVARIRQQVEDGMALHHENRYDSVAKMLPGLLAEAETAVAVAAEADRREAIRVRTHALLLAGGWCTQTRQYDMAYQAYSEGIRLARDAGETLLATKGVVGMCWLFLRLDRFDDVIRLASATADEVEPRFSSAPVGQIAVWGELALRVAAAAVRDNRPDEAAEARRMAATAAGAVGTEHKDYRTHFSSFGPVTAELKVVEDLSLAGDARGVLRRTDDGVLSRSTRRTLGRPTNANWNRHRLDVAKAHLSLGSTQEAMDELTHIRRSAGNWIKHQPMARDVMSGVLHTRKRTLSREMREMAAHLNVHA